MIAKQINPIEANEKLINNIGRGNCAIYSIILANLENHLVSKKEFKNEVIKMIGENNEVNIDTIYEQFEKLKKFDKSLEEEWKKLNLGFRKKISDYISLNIDNDIFEQIKSIITAENLKGYENIDEENKAVTKYLNSIKSDGFFLTEFEINTASKILGYPIIIKKNGLTYYVSNIESNKENTQKTIYLYFKNKHYQYFENSSLVLKIECLRVIEKTKNKASKDIKSRIRFILIEINSKNKIINNDAEKYYKLGLKSIFKNLKIEEIEDEWSRQIKLMNQEKPIFNIYKDFQKINRTCNQELKLLDKTLTFSVNDKKNKYVINDLNKIIYEPDFEEYYKIGQSIINQGLCIYWEKPEEFFRELFINFNKENKSENLNKDNIMNFYFNLIKKLSTYVFKIKKLIDEKEINEKQFLDCIKYIQNYKNNLENDFFESLVKKIEKEYVRVKEILIKKDTNFYGMKEEEKKVLEEIYKKYIFDFTRQKTPAVFSAGVLNASLSVPHTSEQNEQYKKIFKRIPIILLKEEFLKKYTKYADYLKNDGCFIIVKFLYKYFEHINNHKFKNAEIKDANEKIINSYSKDFNDFYENILISKKISVENPQPRVSVGKTSSPKKVVQLFLPTCNREIFIFSEIGKNISFREYVENKEMFQPLSQKNQCFDLNLTWNVAGFPSYNWFSSINSEYFVKKAKNYTKIFFQENKLNYFNYSTILKNCNNLFSEKVNFNICCLDFTKESKKFLEFCNSKKQNKEEQKANCIEPFLETLQSKINNKINDLISGICLEITNKNYYNIKNYSESVECEKQLKLLEKNLKILEKEYEKTNKNMNPFIESTLNSIEKFMFVNKDYKENFKNINEYVSNIGLNQALDKKEKINKENESKNLNINLYNKRKEAENGTGNNLNPQDVEKLIDTLEVLQVCDDEIDLTR